MTLIAPSILSTDFSKLGDTISMLQESNADWIHLDIMDGVFVPNLTFGFPVIRAIRKHTTKPLDVHLMMIEPEKYFIEFREAGADILSVHVEVCQHLQRNLSAIRQLGMKAGVALNPHTPSMFIENVLHDVDLILIMSVNPGFGGQEFIPQTIQKIKKLKKLLIESGSNALIEVDGGVGLNNAQSLIEAGADVLVAGNSIFSHANPEQIISQLKQLEG
ncbi:MAG: ribulose-phosphate 3-epimerase [Lentimicrobium sp.]|jgi:ribulose-phosphate 3-epimerase